ncbi:hypothetical protein ACJX0J_022912 [Zea mays]
MDQNLVSENLQFYLTKVTQDPEDISANIGCNGANQGSKYETNLQPGTAIEKLHLLMTMPSNHHPFAKSGKGTGKQDQHMHTSRRKKYAHLLNCVFTHSKWILLGFHYFVGSLLAEACMRAVVLCGGRVVLTLLVDREWRRGLTHGTHLDIIAIKRHGGGYKYNITTAAI